jgi:hypothetical protein
VNKFRATTAADAVPHMTHGDTLHQSYELDLDRATAKLPNTEVGGVWVAFYQDGSGVYLFRSEVEALRFAVDRSAAVVFVEWGVEVREATRQ